MRRQFQRECMKLEMNDKKMQKDLKKMLKDKTPNVLLPLAVGQSQDSGYEHPEEPKVYPEIQEPGRSAAEHHV